MHWLATFPTRHYQGAGQLLWQLTTAYPRSRGHVTIFSKNLFRDLHGFGHTASNGCRRIHGMEWTKANGHPMNTRRASQRIENIGFLAIVEDWLFLQFVFIWRIITSLKPVGEMILGVVLKTKQRAYCKIKYMEVNLFANENETVKAHVLCFCSWCT